MALLGNLTGSAQYFSNELFYNGVATQSLRLDKASSGYLYRTPSSGSNRRTFTIAFWYKTSIVFASEANDQNNPIFYADEPDGGGAFQFNISGQGQGAATDTVNELQYYDYDSGDSTDYGLETNSAFSDPSAWYHIVMAFDTTQGTEANRVKVYINGVQRAYTDMNAHHGAVIQNRELNVNQATPHWIGRNIDTTSRYMNGYLADFNFVDGTQYAASDFGEFKNGIWIPKEPSVTYGTNGFRLQFKNTGTGTASASTIGADTSGNDNHFTSSGIAANDCAMPDCPENNFATMNSIDNYNTGVTYSEGNLKWTIGVADGAGRATFVMTSGKWYTEFLTNADYIGVVSGNADIVTVNGSQTVFYAGDGTKRVNGSSSSYGASYSDGDIIGIALNMDDEEVTFYKNNSSQGTISLTSVGNEGYTVSPASGAGSKNATANFGQDSSFAGAKTAQGNTDGNGIGDFYYAPPSGFLALCSANLPEPTIGPNSATQSDDYFNTVLWSGNSSSGTTISGVGFKPDWSWIKARESRSHVLFDSSRGVTKYMSTNSTDAEATNTEGLQAFASDGVTLGSDSTVNHSSYTYVGWNWKANGGTTTTNDASATSVGSQDSVYQANTTAGFSIVTYTGTGSNDTFAHGLGVAPNWIIHKRRDSAQHWVHYHVGIGNTRSVLFNTDAQNSASAVNFNNTSPTSTVFSLGTDAYANASGGTYVAYCFHSVEGYSKFGSFSGNDNADGPFVYTGFRPAFFILRDIANVGSWVIYDSVRDTINPAYKKLDARSTGAESTNSGLGRIDFLSNGFKIRDNNSNSHMNQATSSVFIYMAFAEAPFKYANAR